MKSLKTKYLPYLVSIIMPVSLGIAFVLATGSHVQLYLLSLLNTDIPSIYGSAYRDSFTSFPRINEWVGDGFDWPFLLMALLITLFAVRRAVPRLVAWRAAVASPVVLSVADLTHGYLDERINVTERWFVENAFGNLLGGILIAAVLVTVLSVAELLYRHYPGGNIAKRIAAGAAAVLSGLFCSCLIYYVADFFYNTLPVRLEASFAAPANGSAFPLANVQSSVIFGKDTAQPFSFVPEKPISGNATWTSGQQGVDVKLLSSGSGQTYQVSVALLSGCHTPDQVKALIATSSCP